jgi:hypothetical protein
MWCFAGTFVNAPRAGFVCYSLCCAAASDMIDIYDGGSGLWTTALLSSARYDLAATSLPGQSLALFAGGYDGSGKRGTRCSISISQPPFSRMRFADYSANIDIFNAATGQWTVAYLSAARSQLAAASLPGQGLVMFAGGAGSSGCLLFLHLACSLPPSHRALEMGAITHS